jgi:DHA1 family multidrug resistance protein-like MFS transporter
MDNNQEPSPAYIAVETPWKVTLAVMFIGQLLSMIGFAFVLPFIPFYIRELGVTDERLVPIWAGAVAASSSLVMTIFSPIWGWLADRYGRKIMVERAMFGGAILTIALAMISNVYQLLFLRMLAGATTGTIAASLSMVSTIVPRYRLGFSLGLMQVAVFLGMTLGPWIGGLLADAVGYRYTFIAGGIILLSGGILVLVGAKESFTRPTAASLEKQGSLKSLLAVPGFIVMMAVFFLFHFSSNIPMPIFPLFIETMTAVKAKVASTTGLLFAVSGGAAALAAGGIGYLSDKKGYRQILVICLILTALTYLFQGIAQNISQMLMIRICFGLAAGGIIPTMNALVGNIIPHDSYGKAFGMTASMTCLGMAVGPLVGGFMASYLGYRWPFILVSIALMAIVLPVVLRVRQKQGPA